MAGLAGFEPTITGPKPVALPLGYSPINGGGSRTRTYEPDGSGFTVRRVWPTSLSLQHEWCRPEDLNPQPTDYKSVALPIELDRQAI
jgi:hypothetical protein